MKLGLVAAVLLACVRAASADPAGAYPTTVVDRPLNLLPGMTSLEVSELVSSLPMKTLQQRTTDIAVFHGFGPLEVGAELGDYAVLHLSLTTHAIPESIEIFGLSGVPQKDDSLHVAQGAAAGHRFHLVPGALAVATAVGVTVSENRTPDATGTLAWSQVLAGYANARVELQIMPHNLALFAGLDGNAPLSHWGGPDFVSSLGGSGGAIVTVGDWDIYVSSGVRSFTDRRLPYIGGGLTKRWGN